jgi:hypothetical protein
MKRQFARHGIPHTLVTDNGPQLDSSEFKNFLKEWDVMPITSSPRYPQSNGKSESAVKIAKRILKKATRSGSDVWKAILDWRNTPTEGMDSSPAQRLMSRRTRTMLPTARPLLKPEVINKVPEGVKLRRQKAKLQFDKGAKDLPELEIGEQIRLQPDPGNRNGMWRAGTCLQKVAPRSYLVEVEGKRYRRNRKFLHPAKTTDQRRDPSPEAPIAALRPTPRNKSVSRSPRKQSTSVEPGPEMEHKEDHMSKGEETANAEKELMSPARRSRKPPGYLKDYVTN